jgi:hypothetical protein
METENEQLKMLCNWWDSKKQEIGTETDKAIIGNFTSKKMERFMNFNPENIERKTVERIGDKSLKNLLTIRMFWTKN